MPIHHCTLPGGADGFKWGSQGKCYAKREDAERQAEAAYAHGYAGDAMPTAAGVLMLRGGEVYLCQRNDGSAWALPGGMVEPGEEPIEAALRELTEETGLELDAKQLHYIGVMAQDDVDFVTYLHVADDSTKPRLLGEEHMAHAWFNVHRLPEPLHSGVERIIRAVAFSMAADCLAMDRATVRTIDKDGRLHVEITNISKANVCPYYGREIPRWQELGLDPERRYMLLRDPVELAKAAPTFNNLPLLREHVIVTADAPKPEYVVGSLGTDACFEFPYLKNSLVVWDAGAIAGVETGEQKELSSAYRYDVEMTPGVFEGVPYDGRMTNIVGNHVALVEVGRAGADVVVGDSQPAEFDTMTKEKLIALAIRTALAAHLRPALAADAKPIPMDALIKPGQTPKQIAAAAAKHYKGQFDVNQSQLENILKLAMDEAEKEAAEDEEEEEEEEEGAEDESEEEREEREKREKEAKDKKAKDKRAKDKKAMDKRAKDVGPGGPEDRSKGAPRVDAHDAALIEQRAAKRFMELREAEKLVAPLVGELAAMDSAEAVYRHTLTEFGVDSTNIHASALPAMVQLLVKQHEAPSQRTAEVAMDSDAAAEFKKKYPNAANVRRI